MSAFRGSASLTSGHRFGACRKRSKEMQGGSRQSRRWDHSDIDEWFGRLMPYLQPIVKELDESIRAVVPGVHYAVKWKRAFYGLPGLGWIIELAPYDVSVNVVFFGGADFDPPPPLGTTVRTRYIKVTTLEEGQRPEP